MTVMEQVGQVNVIGDRQTDLVDTINYSQAALEQASEGFGDWRAPTPIDSLNFEGPNEVRPNASNVTEDHGLIGALEVIKLSSEGPLLPGGYTGLARAIDVLRHRVAVTGDDIAEKVNRDQDVSLIDTGHLIALHGALAQARGTHRKLQAVEFIPINNKSTI
jgi:hypothetical protein